MGIAGIGCIVGQNNRTVPPTGPELERKVGIAGDDAAESNHRRGGEGADPLRERAAAAVVEDDVVVERGGVAGRLESAPASEKQLRNTALHPHGGGCRKSSRVIDGDLMTRARSWCAGPGKDQVACECVGRARRVGAKR